MNGFRSAVSNNRLVAALVAGFVGTHMATVTGYWYRMIGFKPGEGFVSLDWPVFNGVLIRPNAEFGGPDQFATGWVFHSLTGFCFTLIFAFLIHPRLPAGWSNLIKGLAWGGFLAVLSALWWTPANFPAFNPGFLSLNLGWRTTVGIFIWHAVYGVHVGAFYNPLPDEKGKSK
jgi:hypothetical protein